eukprot:Sdes_comp18071_c0_seq4m7474
MPLHLALKCCQESCGMFQVHQERKDKKWSCKICGFKQSLKFTYKAGSPVECRKFVQELNRKKGETIEKKLKTTEFDFLQNKEKAYEEAEKEPAETQQKSSSKWSIFMEANKDSENEEINCDQEDENFRTTTNIENYCLGEKRKRKSKWE